LSTYKDKGKTNQNRISKDQYFMELAEIVSKRSTCIKRKVGAVLIKDNHILSTGYNGAPSGFTHCTIQTCVRKNLKPGKHPELCRGVHAEANCVSGNSLLILPDGQIEEACNINSDILSINENLKVTVSNAFKFNSIKETLIIIKTVGNFELTVSSDHTMFVMDEKEGLDTKKAINLTIDDYIPLITGVNIEGKLQSLPKIEYDSYELSDEGLNKFINIMNKKTLSQNKLAQMIKMSRMPIQRILKGEGVRKANIYKIFNAIECDLSEYLIGIERKKVVIPDTTSPILCQIIGYFIGDGSLGKNYIMFYDKNREMLEIYKELIQKIFGINGKIFKNKNENQYRLIVSSKRLFKFFKVFNIGIGEKRIPKLFHKVKRKSLASLLRGLFDAEGMVRERPKQIALTSGFRRILEVVRLLLLRFQIVSSIYALKRTSKISSGSGDYSYILTISGEDLFKFKREINFSHPKKKKKLENIKNVGFNKKRVLPKEFFRSRIPTTNFPTLRDKRWKMITQKKAKEIISKLNKKKISNKVFSEIKKLVNSDITFVKIREVKKVKTKEEMIDFHVPIGNSFIANGILVHNCIIQAALHGTSIEGDTTLYCTTFPCMSCLKLLMNAKVNRIVYKEGYFMENKVKQDLVDESKIKIEQFSVK